MIEVFEKWAAYAFAALMILTPAMLLLRPLAVGWIESAKATKTPLDDRAARALVKIIDGAAWLVAVFPRITFGLGEAKRLRDALKAIPVPPRPPTALLMLLVLLPLATTSVGCAGAASQTMRHTLLEVDGYVDGINERVGAATDAAHVRAEAAAEAAPEGHEREAFDEVMRPWERVGAAITTVQIALLSTATAILSVDAGREGDVFGSIACAVRALTELTDLLPAVGIDVPDKLSTAIVWLKALGGAACPTPPAPDPSPPAPSAAPEVTS